MEKKHLVYQLKIQKLHNHSRHSLKQCGELRKNNFKTESFDYLFVRSAFPLVVIFSLVFRKLPPSLARKIIGLNIAIKRSFLSRAGRSKIEATHNFATDLWRRKFGKVKCNEVSS